MSLEEKYGFIDWNQLSMDDLADFLEEKYRFHSTGTAFAVMRMIEFYHENKSESTEN